MLWPSYWVFSIFPRDIRFTRIARTSRTKCKMPVQQNVRLHCETQWQAAFTFEACYLTEVLYNAQRDLQEDTGVFTCRVPGNSHFLFDVELQHCKVIVRLMRNKSSVLEKHQVSTKESRNLSGMLTLPLSVDKKVWLEAEVETEEPEQATVTIYFSGFLTWFWPLYIAKTNPLWFCCLKQTNK